MHRWSFFSFLFFLVEMTETNRLVEFHAAIDRTRRNSNDFGLKLKLISLLFGSMDDFIWSYSSDFFFLFCQIEIEIAQYVNWFGLFPMKFDAFLQLIWTSWKMNNGLSHFFFVGSIVRPEIVSFSGSPPLLFDSVCVKLASIRVRILRSVRKSSSLSPFQFEFHFDLNVNWIIQIN